MLKPRSPEQHEFSHVVDFLNQNLRSESIWPINLEYPTALTPHNIHNMSIITDEAESKIISHALLKPVITKTPQAIFKIGAIGSVVTDPAFRNQGLSTMNLQNCLDKATAQECDLVILWTDKFDFYRKFGFELAGFEYAYTVDQALEIQDKDLKFIKGPQVDPQAILRLYTQHTTNSVRTVEDIAHYMKIPNSEIFTAWNKQNQLIAYAVAGKGADLQNFVHEWGGQVNALVDLLHHIVATEKKSYMIMVPEHAQNLRRKFADLNLFCHQGFLGMIRIHHFENLTAKIKKAFRAAGHEHFVLEKQNGQIVFGYGTDLYTLDKETDLVRILFGPAHIADLDFIKGETRDILADILPLPLWVWGWDSI